MTGTGLFRRLDYPRAPSEIVDSGPSDQILAEGGNKPLKHTFSESQEADPNADL